MLQFSEPDRYALKMASEFEKLLRKGERRRRWPLPAFAILGAVLLTDREVGSCSLSDWRDVGQVMIKIGACQRWR